MSWHLFVAEVYDLARSQRGEVWNERAPLLPLSPSCACAAGAAPFSYNLPIAVLTTHIKTRNNERK